MSESTASRLDRIGRESREKYLSDCDEMPGDDLTPGGASPLEDDALVEGAACAPEAAGAACAPEAAGAVGAPANVGFVHDPEYDVVEDTAPDSTNDPVVVDAAGAIDDDKEDSKPSNDEWQSDPEEPSNFVVCRVPSFLSFEF